MTQILSPTALATLCGITLNLPVSAFEALFKWVKANGIRFIYAVNIWPLYKNGVQVGKIFRFKHQNKGASALKS